MRFLALLMLCIAAHARAESPVLRGATMGTTYHIKLAHVSESLDVESLHKHVESVLAEIDRQMSTYREDSELSQFNRAAANEWFTVSPAVAEVVSAAQSISRKSSGALDITVGPLVELWHFGPSDNSNPRLNTRVAPPSNTKLEAMLERIGYEYVQVRSAPPALRKDHDELEIDLSSIAPGYAIDRLAAQIEKYGVRDYMVEIGGEIRAGGLRPDGQPWRVAIERPLADRREMQSSIPLANAAIATAGDYQKFFEYEGRRYSHIISPETGRPIEHRLASVTVVADTCMAADGWDTPLLVLGPERGLECAEQNEIAALFIARGDAGEVVTTSSEWQKRFGHE